MTIAYKEFLKEQEGLFDEQYVHYSRRLDGVLDETVIHVPAKEIRDFMKERDIRLIQFVKDNCMAEIAFFEDDGNLIEAERIGWNSHRSQTLKKLNELLPLPGCAVAGCKSSGHQFGCCRWCCTDTHDHIQCTDSSRCHCKCHK